MRRLSLRRRLIWVKQRVLLRSFFKELNNLLKGDALATETVADRAATLVAERIEQTQHLGVVMVGVNPYAAHAPVTAKAFSVRHHPARQTTAPESRSHGKAVALGPRNKKLPMGRRFRLRSFRYSPFTSHCVLFWKLLNKLFLL